MTNKEHKARLERLHQMEVDVERIKDEHKWPNWPQLPMKRGPQNEELGVLIVGRAGKWELQHRNLFDRPTANTPVTIYTSPEQVVADGWKVD